MIVEVGLRVNDSDSESCDDRLMTKRECWYQVGQVTF